MKFITIIRVLLLLFTANVQLNLYGVTYTHSLNGTWFLSRPDEPGVINATVPGYIHEALQNAGWGTSLLNENINAWGDSEWTYTSNTFDIPMHIFQSERLELVLEGIDTFAEVYLNDQLILTSNNYFRTYVVDVSGIARMENNYIRVTISPPTRRGEELALAAAHALPGDAIRAVARKPQYHYGWDWGPTITPSGIHGDVYMRGWDKLLVHDAAIATVALENDKAELSFHCELEVTRPMTLNAAVRMTGKDTVYYQNFTFEVKPLKSGRTHLKQSFSIDKPELWWTHDLGEPYLYKCMVVINGEGLEERDVVRIPFATGIRTIALQTKPDTAGESFTFILNGEPVYIRGSNYIPPATFEATAEHRLNLYGQVSPDERSGYLNKGIRQQLVDDAKAVNMNMLRVWGGGVYERDDFYAYCDQEGLLVWQDFMYACAMYPGDEAFLANARDEAEAHVRRLRKYACIALWCGNNENSEGWHRWGWQADLSKKERKAVWKSYQKLFQKLLPEVVSKETTTSYWESSPMLGRGDVKHTTRGDAHYWGVWHDAEPFNTFESKVPRFMSEFGFQSMPSTATMQQYWKVYQPDTAKAEVAKYQKHKRGFALMNTYMQRSHRSAADFYDWSYLTQLVQRDGMVQGIRAHRFNQPHCMGTLYWQLNDCWPGISWSSIDYSGRWKAMHYALKTAFSPLALWMQPHEGGMRVVAVNDQFAEQPVDIALRLLHINGDTLSTWYANTTTVRKGASVIETWSAKALAEPEFEAGRAYFELAWTWNGQLHHDRYFGVPQKAIPLEPADVKMVITSSDNLTFNITLSADVYVSNLVLNTYFEGDFSDNFFDLSVGCTRTITFTAQNPLEELNLNWHAMNPKP